MYEIPLDPQAISGRLETQQSQFVRAGPRRISGYPHDLRCSDGSLPTGRRAPKRRSSPRHTTAPDPPTLQGRRDFKRAVKYIYIMHVVTGQETRIADTLRLALNRHYVEATILLPRETTCCKKHTPAASPIYPGCLFIGVPCPLTGDDIFAIRSLRLGMLDADPAAPCVRNLVVRLVAASAS